MSSPEQLNDYIKVTNPGVWMALAAIILLLLGICVWGIFGKLETTINVVAVSENGQTVCYVKEENISSFKNEMSVYIGEESYRIKSIGTQPVSVSKNMSEYARHVGDLREGEWVYVVIIDGNIADGTYKAQVVIDSVSPLYFVFN